MNTLVWKHCIFVCELDEYYTCCELETLYIVCELDEYSCVETLYICV